MEKIVSEAKYSREKHKDFYKFHLFKRSGSIKFIGVIIVIMFILAITNTFTKDLKITQNTSQIVFSWVMFAISCSFIPIMVITRVNNIVKQETPELLDSTEKIEVTKIKFTRSNNIVEGKNVFGWRDIQVICENDKYFYIYLSEENGIFIDKNSIVEGDVETFRKMALTNLRTDKKGRPLYKRYQTPLKEYKLEMKMAKKGKGAK